MKALNALESLKLVSKYGIKTVKSVPAKTAMEAAAASRETGFPCAMKILSEKVIHKSDKGGVALHLENETEVKKAFLEMQKINGFEGALVQKMLSGTEIIIGGKKDEQFGPTILFGLGGIFVEVFKDYSVRICPITRKDALEMVQEIKGYKLLEGYRGRPKANQKELIDTLLKTNHLLMEEKSIQELDINPLMVTRNGIYAVDARIII